MCILESIGIDATHTALGIEDKVYLLSDKVIAQEFVREYDVLYKEICEIRGKAFE